MRFLSDAAASPDEGSEDGAATALFAASGSTATSRVEVAARRARLATREMEHLASQELASVGNRHRIEPSRTIVHTRARTIAYLLNLAATRASASRFVSAS